MRYTRRAFVAAIAGGGLALLPGCDRLTADPGFRAWLWRGESLSYRAHRLLLPDAGLAREFTRADITGPFRANGTRQPQGEAYAHHAATAFVHWHLRVDGRVRRPLALSLAALRALPQRIQVTRHDCVEGWSAIAQWQGVPLARLLAAAGPLPDARFAVLHCADVLNGAPYYESIDLIDAMHPQTIVAHALNGAPLPVANGAPLRLRVERQLGYKHAKYLTRIELVSSLAGVHGGHGGYWEDRVGYEWYAGI